jgi:hypothetical protein
MKEESSYFFGKKVTKKLLLNGGCGTGIAKAPSKQKFFCFFFYKKRSASL